MTHPKPIPIPFSAVASRLLLQTLQESLENRVAGPATNSPDLSSTSSEIQSSARAPHLVTEVLPQAGVMQSPSGAHYKQDVAETAFAHQLARDNEHKRDRWNRFMQSMYARHQAVTAEAERLKTVRLGEPQHKDNCQRDHDEEREGDYR